MSRLPIATALSASVAFCLLCSPASAQIRPGIERGDYWGEVRARYRTEVLADVGVVMERWLEAWNNKDIDTATRTYSEDVTLILDQEVVSGVGNARAALGEMLPIVGPIQTGLQDFDVSGDMAFATTRFLYTSNAGTPRRAEVSGFVVWVLVKHTGTWKIRSQVFKQTSG